jgi:hypothetical protein
MEVVEEPSALEVAAAEDPAPEGGAGSDPAPEGVAGNNPALEGVAGNNPAPEGVEACSLSLYCLHGRPHWIAPSPVQGGDGDTRFYGFHRSSRFRGQRARCQEPAACWWG